jgi:hypothetical protein
MNISPLFTQEAATSPITLEQQESLNQDKKEVVAKNHEI